MELPTDQIAYSPVEQSSSQTIDIGKQPVYDELIQTWQECNKPNWDGDGALPINEETLTHTRRLIDALPVSYELPSIGVEPDGEITLEWYRSSKWVFSVSVGPGSILTYAALFDDSNHRGAMRFSDTVPEIMMTLIQKVISHA